MFTFNAGGPAKRTQPRSRPRSPGQADGGGRLSTGLAGGARKTPAKSKHPRADTQEQTPIRTGFSFSTPAAAPVKKVAPAATFFSESSPTSASIARLPTQQTPLQSVDRRVSFDSRDDIQQIPATERTQQPLPSVDCAGESVSADSMLEPA
jgi:hypothetical protein